MAPDRISSGTVYIGKWYSSSSSVVVVHCSSTVLLAVYSRGALRWFLAFGLSPFLSLASVDSLLRPPQLLSFPFFFSSFFFLSLISSLCVRILLLRLLALGLICCASSLFRSLPLSSLFLPSFFRCRMSL